MVSGNIVDMFNNIENISKDILNFGDEIFPWIILVVLLYPK
ncbi:MAG: hypothetical protein CM1200mP10_25930 [Candidatus Neomarinimicrobiota bacterium]|nr:MAG: hypothetical protein CM1200mP10_25930 [Candidatus Neomarinimicrobiota bacterium]